MSKHDDLKHVVRPLPGGGMVLVLDTGATIPPEAEAMLQALYSRDPRSVLEHLKIVAQRGPEKFMASYYVGYGHKSIGDCGTGTIFIEGVSMFGAKAIQDWALYSGQEVSTRYVDFSIQPFVDPVNTQSSTAIQDKLRQFYVNAKDELCEDLKQRYPIGEGENQATYEKAINARAFDILRGYLPGGAMTSLAWHTNLRQAADHLSLLRHHSLPEVRAVAEVIESALQEAFPSSFGHKRYSQTEQYNAWVMENHYFFDPNNFPDFALTYNGLNQELLAQHMEILSRRPAKTELPKFLAECGMMQFSFLLDFGSFRDLQRHRAVIQRMPLLSTKHGFEKWYQDELPTSLRNQAIKLLQEVEADIAALECQDTIRQYYIPMGYLTPCRVTGNLPALVYLCELRSGSTVHATLRKRSQQMAGSIQNELGSDVALYIDTEPTRFDIRRGEQDIVKKQDLSETSSS